MAEEEIRTTVALKLTLKEHQKIKDIAAEKERSVSFIVSQMVKEALAKIKK